MHGIVLSELRKYVESRFGAKTWAEALEHAGIPGSVFLATAEYPDSQMFGAVLAVAVLAKMPIEDVLFELGRRMAPTLASIYIAYMRPEWRAMELLEHVEATIHSVVRARNPGASPPKLVARRISTTEVEIRYDSARKMCALARGLIAGIGDLFGEQLEVVELECMLRGGAACRLLVRSHPAAAPLRD